jgi:hypothetical protein
MGLAIALENERGEPLETVTDPKNLLHRLLEPHQGDSSLLGQIDWYGDTTFNRIQMPLFLLAWQELAQRVETPEEALLVHEIRVLAERCEGDVHLYLKFIGD